MPKFRKNSVSVRGLSRSCVGKKEFFSRQESEENRMRMITCDALKSYQCMMCSIKRRMSVFHIGTK